MEITPGSQFQKYFFYDNQVLLRLIQPHREIFFGVLAYVLTILQKHQLYLN